MSSKICAGIVTFNPDIDLFLQCLNALKKQVDKVYLFDNGSNNMAELKIRLENENVTASYFGINAGIAKALNELCKMAEDDEYDWILTMDQDSICADDMVAVLKEHINDENIGIIAPRVEFRVNGLLIHETRNKNRDIDLVKACITSGSLTRIKAWKDVGGFDEWMFIDHVDNEFCTHLYIKGYKVIRVNKTVLYQRAGEMKYISLPGGKKILLPHYSEIRNYYICRNTVYYLKKYKKHINYRHELMVFAYSLAIKLLFENNRFSALKSTYLGIRDGLNSEIKKLPD